MKGDRELCLEAGDEALVAFTRRIQGGLREYDCVGRYGGEEFLVIAPGSMGKGDKSLYERLRAKVAKAGGRNRVVDATP
jgi:diguanylate cyclase (GGDEF)-like protein